MSAQQAALDTQVLRIGYVTINVSDLERMWLDIYEPERTFIGRPPTSSGYAALVVARN